MLRLALITVVTFGAAAGLTVWSAGNAERGEQLFNKMCTGCHAADSDKGGPRLRGVFGRSAGAVEGFAYSEGMKKARVVWDDANLDKWLTDPDGVVPGNDMAFRLDNAEQRADIVAYLKSLARK